MSDPGRWEPRRRARRRALQAVYQWQINRQAAADIIHQFLETQQFDGVDEDYFRRLVEGVIGRYGELRDRLEPFMDRPLDRCDVMERVILLLGAWQLQFEAESPREVVVSEAVDLAERFGSEQARTYVNAVLDQASRAWAAQD